MGKPYLSSRPEVRRGYKRTRNLTYSAEDRPCFSPSMLIFVDEFHNYSQDAERSFDASNPAHPIPHDSQAVPDISSVDSVDDVLKSRD